ncbi:MAG: ABC transporter permease [Polyangiaceae bacterium]|nr:ABC transporter permease [Polyangiaceae bacterium]
MSARLERAGAIVGLLVLWQLAVSLGRWPSYVLPGPIAVLESAIEGTTSGVLPAAVLKSLGRLALGYGLASSGGIALGIAMGRVPAVERAFGTLLTGLQSLPSICWMPLALLWFGLNEKAILFVVVIATLGTVALAVRDAVFGVPRLWLRAARSMGERGLSLWLRVVLPATLPGTITALRLGWSFAWRALMAGELLFVAGGLGQVMHVGRELNDMARVMAAMLVIAALGLVFDNVVLGFVEARTRRRWGLT